jgi:hypothetical protein
MYCILRVPCRAGRRAPRPTINGWKRTQADRNAYYARRARLKGKTDAGDAALIAKFLAQHEVTRCRPGKAANVAPTTPRASIAPRRKIP